ncbi:MAG TPA: hypothetical protein DDZ51_16260 [Planctomycetaceae bacterium]|nr:hypothetical protein [Planctomycetaceae bacterium]
MGIRFACNHCEHTLNIKRELAGKIGVCPRCGGRIRIPLEDAPRSQPIRTEPTARGASGQRQFNRSVGNTTASVEGSATLDTLESDHRVLDSPLDETGVLWYVRPPAGGQYGPASGEVLRSWIAENRVTASTLIWRDGWPQWRSARETLPELAETTRLMLPTDNGVDSNDLFDDPLMAPSHATAPLLGVGLSGVAAIGQQRSDRTQRRMLLVVGLAVLSIFLILTLVVLAMRS